MHNDKTFLELLYKTDYKETSIFINLNIDGTGNYNVDTGLKFFDHMLEQFAKHGEFDII